MISIELANEQEQLRVDAERLRRAAAAILHDAGVEDGSLSIAVVDDATIHVLNRKYLDHDQPTDVLSFVLEQEGSRLEGEVIVSAETAVRTAGHLDWTADDELLLYVVHGTLHLVGHDDLQDEPRRRMRAAERQYLAQLGVEYRGDSADG